MAKTRAEALAAVAARYPHTTPTTLPPSHLPPYTPDQLTAFLARKAPAQLTMFGETYANAH